MGYYPITLDLTDRPCVVVGGGPVAERKVEGLLAAGARVTVVSPRLTAPLEALARDGRIRAVRRRYRDTDLDGAVLAFVAADEARVNAAVARDGAARGVWVNAADDPAHCHFILPSVLRRGEVTIAVATGGASPALARALREELEHAVPVEVGDLARLLGEVRRELRHRGRGAAPEAWSAAMDRDVRALLARRRFGEARRLVRERLGA